MIEENINYYSIQILLSVLLLINSQSVRQSLSLTVSSQEAQLPQLKKNKEKKRGERLAYYCTAAAAAK